MLNIYHYGVINKMYALPFLMTRLNRLSGTCLLVAILLAGCAEQKTGYYQG